MRGGARGGATGLGGGGGGAKCWASSSTSTARFHSAMPSRHTWLRSLTSLLEILAPRSSGESGPTCSPLIITYHSTGSGASGSLYAGAANWVAPPPLLASSAWRSFSSKPMSATRVRSSTGGASGSGMAATSSLTVMTDPHFLQRIFSTFPRTFSSGMVYLVWQLSQANFTSRVRSPVAFARVRSGAASPAENPAVGEATW